MVSGTLSSIAARVRAEGISNPAVIIVGEVVALRDELRWFDNRPLFGKSLLVPRPAEQGRVTAAAIRARGANARPLACDRDSRSSRSRAAPAGHRRACELRVGAVHERQRRDALHSGSGRCGPRCARVCQRENRRNRSQDRQRAGGVRAARGRRGRRIRGRRLGARGARARPAEARALGARAAGARRLARATAPSGCTGRGRARVRNGGRRCGSCAARSLRTGPDRRGSIHVELHRQRRGRHARRPGRTALVARNWSRASAPSRRKRCASAACGRTSWQRSSPWTACSTRWRRISRPRH